MQINETEELAAALMAGQTVVYPVPVRTWDIGYFNELEQILERHGYCLPRPPPLTLGGTHYELKAAKRGGPKP